MDYSAFNSFAKKLNYLGKVLALFLITPMILLPFSGCATSTEKISIKEQIPTHYGKKSLVNLSHFRIVDDFSSSDGSKNRLGGRWSIESASEADLKTECAEEEEAVAHYGHAMKVSYDFGSGGEAVLKTDLNGLDISQGRALSFWFKFDTVMNPDLSVRITDIRGKYRNVKLTPYLSRGIKEWQEVYIPLSKWKGLDFNRLGELAFIIRGEAEEAGGFYLDHISFFGDENVFFESLKDNLKGFPKAEADRREELLALSDEKLLRRIAKDTWNYFEEILDKRTNLPINRIKFSWQPEIGDYASPTDIGLYFISAICAVELGFISRNRALDRIKNSLKTLESLERWKGFFYNYYSTTNLQVTNRFVSAVDSGWFAAALMVIKAYFPQELGARADAMLGEMNFADLYDASEGKFNIGYDAEAQKYSDYHYGLLNTEARIASYVAIAKGDVEEEHWFQMFRTFPKAWEWQTQVPKGKEKVYRDIRVFQGYYKHKDRKFVPSWGGSLFEFLMPALVVKENELGVNNFKVNNRIAAEIHRDYSLKEKNYPVWGISPCMVDKGTHRDVYREFGIKELGVKGYRDRAVISPYASFLALEIVPEDVFLNIRRLLNLYPIYGAYGFYDSVDLRKPHVAEHYLALDQAMVLIAITNYLGKGIIREKFHSVNGMKKIEALLTEEDFFPAKKEAA